MQPPDLKICWGIRATVAGALALALAVNFNPVIDFHAPAVQAAMHATHFFAGPPKADFRDVAAGVDARTVADWIVRNNKQRAGPFIIADKAGGVMYAFDPAGVLIAKSPALYGKSRSDTLTAAQAAKPIGEITDADKITPAGLFYAKGVDTKYGRGIVLAEYATTRISIHQVATGNKAEHRLGRLQSTSLADHRVTFGCINATAEFISTVVVPFFGGDSVIAVLPEGQGVEGFFGIEGGMSPAFTVTAMNAGRTAGVVDRGGEFYLERRRVLVMRG